MPEKKKDSKVDSKPDAKEKAVLSRKGFKVVDIKKGSKVNIDFDKKNIRIKPLTGNGD